MENINVYVVREEKRIERSKTTGFGYSSKTTEEVKVTTERQYFTNQLSAYEYFYKKVKQHKKVFDKEENNEEKEEEVKKYFDLQFYTFVECGGTTTLLYKAENGEITCEYNKR